MSFYRTALASITYLYRGWQSAGWNASDDRRGVVPGLGRYIAPRNPDREAARLGCRASSRVDFPNPTPPASRILDVALPSASTHSVAIMTGNICTAFYLGMRPHEVK
jgi:hypothetical protein